MRYSPENGILETGLIELVGVDEQVDQNDWSGSVDFDIGSSGYFVAFALISTGGDEIQAEGKLYILDADPAISSGDTSITAAEAKTVVGVVDVASDDWDSDDNHAIAYITDTIVPFHSMDQVYFAFRLTSATSLNSAGGDNELLQLNAWYEKWT